MRHAPHAGLTPLDPIPPPLGDVGARALRPSAVSLYDNPARQSSRDREAGLAVTPRSASSRSANSGMVMSGVACTAAIRNGS
jgi:hypothetical protein